MKEKEAIKKELEELAPGLSKLERKQAFHAPPTYFRDLTVDIMEKVQQQPASNTWMSWLERILGARLKPARLAWQLATVAILIVAGWWVSQRSNETSDFPNLTDLSQEEMQLYVSNHIDEFDVDILLEAGVLDFSDVPLLILDSDKTLEQEDLDDFLDNLDLNELEELL